MHTGSQVCVWGVASFLGDLPVAQAGQMRLGKKQTLLSCQLARATPSSPAQPGCSPSPAPAAPWAQSASILHNLPWRSSRFLAEERVREHRAPALLPLACTYKVTAPPTEPWLGAQPRGDSPTLRAETRVEPDALPHGPS